MVSVLPTHLPPTLMPSRPGGIKTGENLRSPGVCSRPGPAERLFRPPATASLPAAGVKRFPVAMF